MSPKTYPEYPLFSLCDAQVKRNGKTILSVDTLEVAEGESIAILGPNGSGKSTLVRLLTREIHPLHREQAPITFRGSDRISLAALRQTFGVVSATMEQEITVGLPVEKIVEGGVFGTLGVPASVESTPESRARAAQTLATLGIEDLSKQDCRTLSSGQIRRVLIARALVANPEVLILDEPCAGLDPEGMHYIRATMRAIAALGKALILITHYPEDIIPEVKRVLLMQNGHIIADGNKTQLLTDETLSHIFNIPITVAMRTNDHGDTFYSLVDMY